MFLTKKEDTTTEMAEITITENGVRKLLQKLDGHKATGPDDIPAHLPKETAAEPLLCSLPCSRRLFTKANYQLSGRRQTSYRLTKRAANPNRKITDQYPSRAFSVNKWST